MAVRLKKYSFRFSEELFNSRLAQKAEIEQILYAACVDFSKLNRKEFYLNYICLFEYLFISS